MKKLFVGVDGGGSQCTVRVEDENHCLLGQASGGAANIRLSVMQSWEVIQQTLQSILQSLAGMGLHQYELHVGMGLAGCEVHEAYAAFTQIKHDFQSLIVVSDAYTACLGAHGGEDGAIIIVGTGVTGFQMQAKQSVKVSGWGFPHDDVGGGAWLGLQAVRATLHWVDGRSETSGLVEMVYDRFKHNLDRLITWANQANATAFAELAPLVVQAALASDAIATEIMQKAAQAVDKIGMTLLAKQSITTSPLPCALIGGITPFIQPFLSADLRSRLRPCQLTPAAGAILLVRQGS